MSKNIPQDVKIGRGVALPSAILELESTTKGFLPPRMTTLERLGIISPAEGITVYDTDLKATYVFDGVAWGSYVGIPSAGLSTDNAIARWDGAGGSTLQDSPVLLDDLGGVTGITSLDVDNINIDANTISTTDVNGDLTISPNGTGKVVIAKDLQVLGTTTTVNSATLDVADSNISVNVGGNQASADTNQAGIKVTMTDATDVQMAYDSTLTSRFKIGDIGAEVEVADISSAQDITNKAIISPTRLDVKKDTEANLTTYATTAANGQLCFATDTKKMYQVLDGALKAVGGGAGTASTGILTGGEISIGTPTTTVTIADGQGVVVDYHTNPLDPVIVDVTWTGLTNIVVTNLATASASYFGINSAGTLVQQTTQFTSEQHRDIIDVGIAIHVGNTVVEAVSTNTNFLGALGNQVEDLVDTIGPINKSGNVYIFNGANLNIDKDAGLAYGRGINYATSKKSPNIKTQAAGTALTFLRTYYSGTAWIYTSSTTIDPNNRDSLTGLAAVQANKWTIQRINLDPRTGTTVIQYGQAEYNNVAEAEAGIFTEVFTSNPELVNVMVRGWILVKQGATDLSSTTQAKFISADKFGTSTAGGSTSATTTLQKAYENSLPSPEITLNSTQGSLDIRDNATPLGTDLHTVTNSDGSIKYFGVSAVEVAVKQLGFTTSTSKINGTTNNNIQVIDNDGTNVLRSESEVLYIEDFKENDHTIFTGVSGTITLSSNTTTPIGKYRSLKADIVSGLANDSFTSPVIAVTEYMKSFGAVGFFSNTKFNGNTGDMQYLVEFDNGTDWTTIPSQRFDIRNGDKLNKFLFQFDSTCVNFRYTPIITAAGNYVLEIGMVRLVSNPNPTAHLTLSETAHYTGYTSKNASNFVLFKTEVTNEANDLLTVTNTDHTRFTFNDSIPFVVTSARNGDGTSYPELRWYNSSGVEKTKAIEDNTAGLGSMSVSGKSVIGDYIVLYDNGTPSDDVYTFMSITATASSSNVVFEGHATDTEGSPWTPITTGVGTITVYNFTYNRDGKYLIADGYFNAGTTAATKASISLPAGLTIDTSILTRGNTDANPGHIVGEWSEDGTNNSGRMLTATGTSDSVIYFGLQFSTSGALRPQDGNAIINTGNEVAIRFRVPITQWSVADPLISVPVTNEVENVYSARITSAGVITSQSSHFISSVTKGTAGIYTINLVSGFFSVIPSVEGAVEVQSDSVFSGTPTTSTITVEINSSGTKTDRDFSIVVQRQGADYKAPKGYFLGNMARVNHLLGGVEYETGELRAGQKEYAVSIDYNHGGQITTNGLVIASIASGLNVHEITGDFVEGTSVHYPMGAYANSVNYNSSTGSVSYVWTGSVGQQIAVNRVKVTIKYIK